MRGPRVLLLLVLLDQAAEATRPQSHEDDELGETLRSAPAAVANQIEPGIPQDVKIAAQQLTEAETNENGRLVSEEERLKGLDSPASESGPEASSSSAKGNEASSSPDSSSAAGNDALPLPEEPDTREEEILAEASEDASPASEDKEASPGASQSASEGQPTTPSDNEASPAAVADQETSLDTAGSPEQGQPATADNEADNEEAATAPAAEELDASSAQRDKETEFAGDEASTAPATSQKASPDAPEESDEEASPENASPDSMAKESSSDDASPDVEGPSSDDASHDVDAQGGETHHFKSLAPRVNELYNHVASHEHLAKKASHNAVDAFKVMGAYQNSLHDLKQGLQKDLREKMRALADNMVNSLEEQDKDFAKSLSFEVPQDLKTAETWKMLDKKGSSDSVASPVHAGGVEAASGGHQDDDVGTGGEDDMAASEAGDPHEDDMAANRDVDADGDDMDADGASAGTV